jgi:hypothetical protein
MSKPPFTMSKYARREDLLSDALTYYETRSKNLEEVAMAMRDWIDAVPSDTVLPAMPGFDRDWADNVIDDA